MALPISSLSTSAASPITSPTSPASCRSADSFQRAVATLEGAHGSRTTLDALTSGCPSRGLFCSAGHAPIIRPGNVHLPLKHHTAQSHRELDTERSFRDAVGHGESRIARAGAPMRLAWVGRGALGPGAFAGMPGLDERSARTAGAGRLTCWT